MSARLIDLIADHIRNTYSSRTIVEIDEAKHVIRVDGINIWDITEQTIKFDMSDGSVILDAREPNFLDKLSHYLYWTLDTHTAMASRRGYREKKENEGIRQMLGLK